MRVLIALDATPACESLVREAALRPWPVNSEFLLIHVLDPFPFAKAPVSLQRAKDQATRQIEKAAASLIEAGWRVKTDVILGQPRAVLGKYATLWKADLAIVGSYGASALTRLFLGSTARSALRSAPCAVEIVRPEETAVQRGIQKGMRVLVATDGSEFATAALRAVAGRPWPADSKFEVFSVPQPFWRLGEYPYFELKEIEELNAAGLNDAKTFADAGAAILREAGLDARTETPTPRDSDAREILNEADRWKADLIVLGSHGRSGFDRFSMGSVSEQVAMHAPCSVEVICPDAAARAAKKFMRTAA